jgi:hypothetical protein
LQGCREAGAGGRNRRPSAGRTVSHSRHRRVFAIAWRHSSSQPVAASLVPKRTSHWPPGGATVTRSPRRGLTRSPQPAQSPPQLA